MHLNFQELLTQFNEAVSDPVYSKFQEVIELDVMRSFNAMEQEDRKVSLPINLA